MLCAMLSLSPVVCHTTQAASASKMVLVATAAVALVKGRSTPQFSPLLWKGEEGQYVGLGEVPALDSPTLLKDTYPGETFDMSGDKISVGQPVAAGDREACYRPGTFSFVSRRDDGALFMLHKEKGKAY